MAISCIRPAVAVVAELGGELPTAVVLARGFRLRRLWVALYLGAYSGSPVVGVISA